MQRDCFDMALVHSATGYSKTRRRAIRALQSMLAEDGVVLISRLGTVRSRVVVSGSHYSHLGAVAVVLYLVSEAVSVIASHGPV